MPLPAPRSAPGHLEPKWSGHGSSWHLRPETARTVSWGTGHLSQFQRSHRVSLLLTKEGKAGLVSSSNTPDAMTNHGSLEPHCHKVPQPGRSTIPGAKGMIIKVAGDMVPRTALKLDSTCAWKQGRRKRLQGHRACDSIVCGHKKWVGTCGNGD